MALNYTLRLDNRRFTGPAAEAQRSLGGLKASAAGGGGAFASLGKAAGVAGIALAAVGAAAIPILSAGKALSKAAADAESTRVGFQTLVGDVALADKTLKQLQDTAASTPLEFTDIAQAARSLVAFGSAATDVTAEVRMIGDVAQGVQAPLNELAQVYGKARVQGTIYAEELNELTGRGIPIITELAKVTGKNASEIKKLASEGKITFPLIQQAFMNMTNSGGQFYGMMEKQSKTTNGLISTLKDNLHRIWVQLGTKINDKLRPYLESAIGLIQNVGAAIEKGVAVEYLSKRLQLAAIEFGQAFIAWIPKFVTALGDGIKKLLTGLSPADIIAELNLGAGGRADKLREEIKAMEDSFKKGGEEVATMGTEAKGAKEALTALNVEAQKTTKAARSASSSGDDSEEGTKKIRTYNARESAMRRIARMSKADLDKAMNAPFDFEETQSPDFSIPLGPFVNMKVPSVKGRKLKPMDSAALDEIRKNKTNRGFGDDSSLLREKMGPGADAVNSGKLIQEKLRRLTPEELEKARKTIGGGAGRGTRAAREAAAAEAQANSPETKLEAIRALLEKIAGGMEAIGAV